MYQTSQHLKHTEFFPHRVIMVSSLFVCYFHIYIWLFDGAAVVQIRMWKAGLWVGDVARDVATRTHCNNGRNVFKLVGGSWPSVRRFIVINCLYKFRPRACLSRTSTPTGKCVRVPQFVETPRATCVWDRCVSEVQW